MIPFGRDIEFPAMSNYQRFFLPIRIPNFSGNGCLPGEPERNRYLNPVMSQLIQIAGPAVCRYLKSNSNFGSGFHAVFHVSNIRISLFNFRSSTLDSEVIGFGTDCQLPEISERPTKGSEFQKQGVHLEFPVFSPLPSHQRLSDRNRKVVVFAG